METTANSNRDPFCEGCEHHTYVGGLETCTADKCIRPKRAKAKDTKAETTASSEHGKTSFCHLCQNLQHGADGSEFCLSEECPVRPVYEQVIHTKAETQDAKADAGKVRLTLVPRKIIWYIGKIREYGNKKYGDPENWRKVDIQRYRDAAYRHWLAYLDDPHGVDKESGLPHLWHVACNIAFLCEMEVFDI